MRVIADRFELDRLVREGGMGQVYRAHDRHTEALAAIKLMRAPAAHGVERFLREAQILAELRHPGIVRYLTHGRADDGEIYLAMEWLEGEDLDQRLCARELSTAEAWRLAVQVAAALAAAHARGIVHRDLKPANLFLTDYRLDQVKLLDFGVARVTLSAATDALTDTGAVIGTPRYMAPEQVRGERSIDARADVFALGAVLYRCLAGRSPFRGDNPAALMRAILDDEPPPLAGDAGALLTRMLAKEPARRPRDAAAVLTALLALEATPSTPARAELTAEERRVQCLLVVAGGAPDARVVAAHGGVVDGDVVRFAGQRVLTDQAKLAARCALALRRPDLALALVMGRRGDAHAQAPLTPGEIHLEATVAGLLDARFLVAGGLVLHGEADDDDARPLLGRPTPFVGRDQERAQIEAVLGACAAESQARVVLVSAPAGAGKTRLRVELCRGRAVWLGRGDPMRAGAPFGLLGEAVRRAAGITGDEPAAARRTLLRQRVGRHLPAPRRERVAELIGELAGVPFPAEDSPPLRAARRDPALLADQLRAAWVEWLDAECAAAPLILVLEDLHWGDLPTVKLVDHALAALAERPFFVLALARPEVRELFPRLWAERGVQEIHLAPLSRRSAERLVREVLGELDATRTAAIVERASGNPLYLEELIRHDAAGERLPDSVLAMVSQRFERFGGELRRALRAASVFGEVFWADGVAALLGAPAPTDELIALELIRRRHDPRLAGQDELAFGHGLLRDAAYAQLTDADRVLGHRLAGEWLERAGEPESLVLAEHFERGAAPARAARWFARAAEQALAGNDPAAAIALAERGVAAGGDRGPLRLVQALAYRMLADVRTHAAAAEAAALLPRGGESWFRAVAEAALAAAMGAATDEVRRFAEAALAATPSPPSPATATAMAITLSRIAIQCGIGRGPRDLYPVLVARLPHVDEDAFVAEARSYDARFARDPEGWYALVERSHGLYRAAGDDRSACTVAVQLVGCDLFFGELDRAQPRAAALLVEATRLGMSNIARGARVQLAEILAARGRPDEAVAEASRAAAGASVYPAVACAFQLELSRVLAAAGRLDEAEAIAGAAVAAADPGWPVFRWAASHHARLLARAGRGDEALALLARVPIEDGFYFLNSTLASAAGATLLALAEAQLSLGHDAGPAVAAARGWAEARVRAVVSPARWESCARVNPVIRAILALDGG